MTTEPIEQRLLNSVGAALGVAFWVVLIWHYLDPDGPTSFLEQQRDHIREWRAHKEAMRRTFEDIDNLPEVKIEEVDNGAQGT